MSVPCTSASTSVPLGDGVYDLLGRLEAEGLVRSSLLSTRPISRNEAARLLREAESRSLRQGGRAAGLVSALRDMLDDGAEHASYVKPLDRAYAGYTYSNNSGGVLDYNSDGDIREEGSSGRLGFDSIAELDWFSLYANPQYSHSEEDDDLRLVRAYGVLSFLGLELQAGSDSQWWGPGYHGALLVSNNAQPLSLVKISNPTPVLLPTVFRHMGPVRFSLFVSRLEQERAVPEPYLWGLRFDLKPSPYVELGLQRTALLGGEGRSSDAGTWWRSFTGRGENEAGREAGDQRAGGDLKITLPFKAQPVQIYVEAAGEDESGGLPSKWAYLAGLYLPRLYGIDGIGLRAEYANNKVGGGATWYSHHIYRTGYRYKGRVIGHHMGGDSDDLYIEAKYSPRGPGGTEAGVYYDRERHGLSLSVVETSNEYAAFFGMPVGRAVRIGVSCRYAKSDNFDNIRGNGNEASEVAVDIGLPF